MTATVQRVLDEAADLIEREGWWQRGGGEDGYCPITALGTLPHRAGLLALAMTELRARVGGSIIEWNDEPGRTKAEVLALLRPTEVHDTGGEPDGA